MSDRPRIEIDLNVRTRNNETYAGIEDADTNDPNVGDEVYVVQSEDEIIGDATITRIDLEKDLVYLAVDWTSLRDDPEPPADVWPSHDR